VEENSGKERRGFGNGQKLGKRGGDVSKKERPFSFSLLSFFDAFCVKDSLFFCRRHHRFGRGKSLLHFREGRRRASLRSL
jgi:hypothetical protein